MDIILIPVADLAKYYVKTEYLPTNTSDAKVNDMNMYMFAVVTACITFMLRYCTVENIRYVCTVVWWWIRFRLLQRKALILPIDRIHLAGNALAYPPFKQSHMFYRTLNQADTLRFFHGLVRLGQITNANAKITEENKAWLSFWNCNMQGNIRLPYNVNCMEMYHRQVECFDEHLQKLGCVPLLYKDGYLMYVRKSYADYYEFCAMNEQVITDLITEVATLVTHQPVVQKYGNIYEADVTGALTTMGQVKTELTFDNYVSRHKTYILDRLEAFKEQRLFRSNPYVSNNIGLLLYGGYGTGKTYLVSAVAQYLERDIIMVNLARLRTKTAFRALFAADNINKYVYCFDEFDYVLASFLDKDIKAEMQSEKNAQMQMLMTQLQGVKDNHELATKLTNEIKTLMEVNSSDVLTYEFMLSEISGLQDVKGRVIIATTNFLNKIPSAMLRPGRLDTVLCFDCFNRQEIQELVIRMYPDSTGAERCRIDHAVPFFKEETFTPAEIIQKKCEFEDLDKLLTWLCGGVDIKTQ